MEIVDVTYNFELFEDAALKVMKNFNDCVDKVLELKELWEGISKYKNIEKQIYCMLQCVHNEIVSVVAAAGMVF